MKNIPTEKDWAGYHNDIDARYSYKMFFGKSNEEMQPAFKNNVIERTDELRFMPDRAFRYYILGLRDHVQKRDFDEFWGADAASCFITLIQQKLNDAPGSVLPVIDELLPVIEFVAKNQALYEADIDIYGNFQDMYQNILKLAGKNA